MPDAIPSGDEVVGVWRCPSADIGVVKNNVRMPQPSQPEHLGGQIQPFDVKALPDQQVDKTTATAAPNIKCLSVMLNELKRTHVLGDAIGAVKSGAGPSLG
jgi:hypothetical protein